MLIFQIGTQGILVHACLLGIMPSALSSGSLTTSVPAIGTLFNRSKLYITAVHRSLGKLK